MKVIKVKEIEGTLPPKHYDLTIWRLVDAADSKNGLRASLGRLEKNGRADAHVHEDADQLFIILKGEMVMKSGQQEVRLKEGEAALIPPGEVHENYNGWEGQTEYLVITCGRPL